MPQGRRSSGLETLQERVPSVCGHSIVGGMKAFDELVGSKWAGRSELWLDPLGDVLTEGTCTLEVQATGITYTWTHKDETKTGSVVLSESGGTFTDTFHSPSPMECRNLVGNRGLFLIEGSYGEKGEWGWLIGLSHRTPTGELVLQMTNIAYWGEEARAVRFICKKQ